jgi:hypothetical protein
MANVILRRLNAIRLFCYNETLTLGLEGGDVSHEHDAQIEKCVAAVLLERAVLCVYDGFPNAKCLLYFDRERGVLEIKTPVVVLRFLLNAQLNVELERALREVS